MSVKVCTRLFAVTVGAPRDITNTHQTHTQRSHCISTHTWQSVCGWTLIWSVSMRHRHDFWRIPAVSLPAVSLCLVSGTHYDQETSTGSIYAPPLAAVQNVESPNQNHLASKWRRHQAVAEKRVKSLFLVIPSSIFTFRGHLVCKMNYYVFSWSIFCLVTSENTETPTWSIAASQFHTS